MGYVIHGGGIDGFALLDDIQRCRRLSTLEERMAEPQAEKRAARRFALRIPVNVDHGENPSHSEVVQIRDVSARGICFYLDSALAQGAPIGFTLTLPPEIKIGRAHV